jgi:hypothetical protein
MRPNRTRGLLSIAAAFLLFPISAASASLDTALADFKQCLDNNMAAERAKERRSVNALLKTCNAEYQAVSDALHPGARDQVLHDLKDQIRDQLNK